MYVKVTKCDICCFSVMTTYYALRITHDFECPITFALVLQRLDVTQIDSSWESTETQLTHHHIGGKSHIISRVILVIQWLADIITLVLC